LFTRKLGSMNNTVQQDNLWDFGKIDWDEYESHRPPYPDELYKIIFKYHGDHQGRWSQALDVGAGGGTVTKELLSVFDHVYCSDAAAGYVAQAQERFATEKEKGSITFLQRKFHEFKPEQDFDSDDQLVDLITAGTCIHLAPSPGKVMSLFAPLLRSGGTVAVISYGTIPITEPDEPAGPLIYNALDAFSRYFHDKFVETRNHPGAATMQARYENVEFDPAVWRDVRRLKSLSGEYACPKWIESSAPNIGPNDTLEKLPDDFVMRVIDYEFLVKYFHNFGPGMVPMSVLSEHLAELKKVMSDRKIVVKWPFMGMLATKQ
jgi:SAM-dependent methyltransferase